MNPRLTETLNEFRNTGAYLAFSGGVDSALLLALCVREQIPVTAVTFQTTLHPRCDLENAQAVAQKLGVRHVVLEIDEMTVPEILKNPPDRCYHCKKHLFRTLRDLAAAEGCPIVLDGTNADDLTQYRPGLRALRELGIRSPLAECGVTKTEVRTMAAELGLPTASRPSSPCLATRLPYYTRITPELLRKIEAGEDFLKGLGFPVVRLRTHPEKDGLLARIEIPPEQFPALLARQEEVSAFLREQGFARVTLDLEGFRSGSYDRGLSPQNSQN